MNDELQKQIAEILKQALAAAQHGGRWLVGQLPDVLHELLTWTVAMGVLSIIGLIALVIFYFWVGKRAWKEDEFLGMMAFGLGGLVATFPASFLMDSVLDGIKALIAPKLFLLEYAAHLVH